MWLKLQGFLLKHSALMTKENPKTVSQSLSIIVPQQNHTKDEAVKTAQQELISMQLPPCLQLQIIKV